MADPFKTSVGLYVLVLDQDEMIALSNIAKFHYDDDDPDTAPYNFEALARVKEAIDSVVPPLSTV